MAKRYYRKFHDKALDSSLYLEERTDGIGRKYYCRIEDYSDINKGIAIQRIRRVVFERAIAGGSWLQLTREYKLV